MRDEIRAASALEAAIGLHQQGRAKDAEAAYRRVLALDPSNADALGMLGLIRRDRGEPGAAERLLRASLALKPTALCWYNLGLVLEGRCEVAGALAAFRQAALLDPADVTNWSSAIFLGDLHPYATPQVRLADRRTFNRVHCAALTAAAAPHQNDRDPDRRLRVGYLSADFVDHSSPYAFEPVLKGHDRSQVEIFLYWQQRQPRDSHTERFQGYADDWNIVNGWSDVALAEHIRHDQIDILVDLAGYSNGHRLLALARKPAPIIMTGWGHVTGLGIDASDYLLADAVTVPEGAESLYHEQILRLPCAMAFDPRPPYPDVAPPPSSRVGHVSFGYFGRATKLSEPVWAVWAEILNRVPGSRLVFKGREYTVPTYRQRIAEFFASLRISSHRLDFLGHTDRPTHLAAYGGIDIALDAFPQNGGVTTLEACLMGVPTVTLLGDHLNGRIGASILSVLDCPQFVGIDRQHYVDIAVAMANTPPPLDARQALRDRLLGSFLVDDRFYAGNVEALYRQAWKTWLAATAPAQEASRRQLVGV